MPPAQIEYIEMLDSDNENANHAPEPQAPPAAETNTNPTSNKRSCECSVCFDRIPDKDFVQCLECEFKSCRSVFGARAAGLRQNLNFVLAAPCCTALGEQRQQHFCTALKDAS